MCRYVDSTESTDLYADSRSQSLDFIAATSSLGSNAVEEKSVSLFVNLAMKLVATFYLVSGKQKL